MQHLEEGTIHAWLDDALPADEAARVEQHVAECAECAALVAEARGLIAGAARIVSSLDIVRGDVVPKPKPAPRTLWTHLHLTPSRAALAATLLIAVASTLVVRHAPTAKQNAVLEQARGISQVERRAAADTVPAAPTVSAPAMSALPPAPQPMATAKSAPPIVAPTVAADAVKDASEKADKKTLIERDAAAAAPTRVKRDSAVLSSIVVTGSSAAVAAKVEPAPAPEPTPAMAASGARALTRAPERLAVNARADTTKVSGVPVLTDAAQRGAGFDPRTLKPNDANPATQLPMNTADRRMAFGQLTQGKAAQSSLSSGGAGCYTIEPDTSALSHALPAHFGLAIISADSSRIVRAVTPAGVVDTLIRGSTWSVVDGAAVRVVFARTASATGESITLALPRAGANALATSATIRRVLTVRPFGCHE